MEQPPGSLDDLQPQDLSTCSLPTVIDLTRKGEECVLNANSLDAIHMVKSPGWYPNSGINKTGLPFTETATSDIRLQSGDQIQPDNAFSNTTMTLSYMSRSLLSTHDSMSQTSALYGVPSVGKFSLPSSYEMEKGLGETSYALSQHYLEQAERPLDLATQTELFKSLSHAQLENGHENIGGICDIHESNGGVVSSDRCMDKPLPDGVEYVLPRDTEDCTGFKNGQDNSRSSSGDCMELSPEILTAYTDEDQERSTSEVFFLISRAQEPLVIQDSMAVKDLCSLSREFISPLEDPVSPSATSLDDMEDVFILPQASSSPSGSNSFLEEAGEAVWDGLHKEDTIQLSTLGSRSSCNSTPRLDISDECKLPVHRRKAPLQPMTDLTDEGNFLSEVSEKNLQQTTVTPHINGNMNMAALQCTFRKKKLPVRSGRGTRLEAIVMNINPSRCKVSRQGATTKKRKASYSTDSVSELISLKKNDALFVRKKKGTVKTSVKKRKLKAETLPKSSKTGSINTDSCRESTSDSEITNNSKNSLNSTPPKISSHQFAVHKSKQEPGNYSHPELLPKSSPKLALCRKSNKKTKCISSPSPSSSKSSPQVAVKRKTNQLKCTPCPDPSPKIDVARKPPPTKSPKKSPTKQKDKARGGKISPATKKKALCPPRRKRKKHKPSQSSSMFSPKEPEIKLKYVNFKEEKRDLRLDSFSPFIRVEHRQSSTSLCTVINYPEETTPQQGKGQQLQGHTGGLVSGVMPSTSCLKLGRVSVHSQHHSFLVCCLCGKSANAVDLGDLHGPYYPEGYRPTTKTPVSTSGLKEEEEDYSYLDSSSCSMRGKGRKCTRPLAVWPRRPGSQLKQKDPLGRHRWTSNSDPCGSPASKRAQGDANAASVEDWYSPPVVPLEPCEYWLHEDCGVWSAGVFLVKGKVYGLEKAVKVAQETMCSGCCKPGATLGCFFKGCPSKYHYRCAIESDCVLIEENFSMRCKKHKNKTFIAPPGNRWDDR
ncbi:transcription factor 20 [Lampris incognitus]|uniref:transcription factor 20 n=1 Tax=Lampris incognitus TaxID=2546036 RepID=UPI0024B610F4|nr:transcription factor 20 [Lampris incognitus]